MANCLVVIDTQPVFVPPDKWDIVKRIKCALDSGIFDYKVATQFKNSTGSMYEKYLNWHGACGKTECELLDFVEENCSHVFIKGQYSCFTKEFIEFIDDNKIDELYFVGFDIDGCVMQSAIGSFDRGIDFYVINDCCGTSASGEIVACAMKVMHRLIGTKPFKLLDEILNELGGRDDGKE